MGLLLLAILLVTCGQYVMYLIGNLLWLMGQLIRGLCYLVGFSVVSVRTGILKLKLKKLVSEKNLEKRKAAIDEVVWH